MNGKAWLETNTDELRACNALTAQYGIFFRPEWLTEDVFPSVQGSDVEEEDNN